jgi:hypothetical protein
LYHRNSGGLMPRLTAEGGLCCPWAWALNDRSLRPMPRSLRNNMLRECRPRGSRIKRQPQGDGSDVASYMLCNVSMRDEKDMLSSYRGKVRDAAQRLIRISEALMQQL